jgi:SAM-dependent methyltransferase
MTLTDYYATRQVFHIAKCEKCGFKMTQDAPVESEIGVYYETPDYISHSDTRKGAMNRIYHHVRNRMLRRKYQLVCKYSGRQNGRLLDIGTGTGYFPAVMQQGGWQVVATEKSPGARTFAVEHNRVDAREEKSIYSMESNSLDVITLWHVMEHIEHINDLWAQLNTLLKPDGVLLVAVPNHEGWDAEHYGGEWAAWDVPRHLWHFSQDTMDRWAERYGMQVVERLPMPFDAFYVSMLSEKYRGHAHSYFLRGALQGFRAYAAAHGTTRKSSSIIYVIKKIQEVAEQ